MLPILLLGDFVSSFQLQILLTSNILILLKFYAVVSDDTTYTFGKNFGKFYKRFLGGRVESKNFTPPPHISTLEWPSMPKSCHQIETCAVHKIAKYWPQNFSLGKEIFFWIFQLWPKFEKYCPIPHWYLSFSTKLDTVNSEVKTGTGSSFDHHFDKKTRFWGFSGCFITVAMGIRNSMFVAMTSLMGLNMQ